MGKIADLNADDTAREAAGIRYVLPLAALFCTASIPAHADVGDAVTGGLILGGLAIGATVLAVVVMLLDMKKRFRGGLYVQAAALCLLSAVVLTGGLFANQATHETNHALLVLPPLFSLLWVYLGNGKEGSLRLEAFRFVRGVGVSCLCVLLFGSIILPIIFVVR